MSDVAGWDVAVAEARRYRFYLPTHSDIEAATAEIRQGWDDAEHRKRAGLSTEPIETPHVTSQAPGVTFQV